VSPSGRWLNAIWLLGNNYRNKTDYYGAFPPGYMPRIRPLFPEIPAARWVHLYAGSLTAEEPGTRIDLRRDKRPTLCADARALPLRDASVPIVSADPPYTGKDALRYGTPIVLNKPKVLREIARVTQPGGFLVWLDTTLPMYRGADWYHFGMICIQRSTNHRTRLCSLFERR
jgi:hypothetical protein